MLSTRVVLLSLLLLAPWMGAARAAAANAPGEITVQTAYVNVRNGVFELNARTVYPLNNDVREALNNGVTIHLELQAVISRERRYWVDATLVDVTLRRELSWHEVSQRFILRDVDRGEQQMFVSLDQALAAAGVVTDWPVVVEPQLDSASTYTIGVRAAIRRGRLPDSLRALFFWSDSWNRSSEWYSWTLPR
jgi:hypothetical protein